MNRAMTAADRASQAAPTMTRVLTRIETQPDGVVVEQRRRGRRSRAMGSDEHGDTTSSGRRRTSSQAASGTQKHHAKPAPPSISQREAEHGQRHRDAPADRGGQDGPAGGLQQGADQQERQAVGVVIEDAGRCPVTISARPDDEPRAVGAPAQRKAARRFAPDGRTCGFLRRARRRFCHPDARASQPPRTAG